MKIQLNSLLEQKIANPSLEFSTTSRGSKLIQAIIELICNEDTSQFSQQDEQDQQYYADDQEDEDYPADQDYYHGQDYYPSHDQGYYVDHSYQPGYDQSYYDQGYHPDHSQSYYSRAHVDHGQKYQAYRFNQGLLNKSAQDCHYDQSQASNYDQGYRSDHRPRYFQDQGTSSSSGHYKGNKNGQNNDDYWRYR